MTQRWLEIQPTNLFGNGAVVISLEGREEISRPFEFRIAIDSPNEDIKAGDVIGKPMAVRIDYGDNKERFIHGYISHLSVGEAEQSQDNRGVPSRIYQIVLVPWLWFLSKASRSFVYLPDKQKKSFQEVFDKIIERVRAYGHVECWHDASGASILKSRMTEHCIQYKETDFNFLSSLLESHGVFYYFKHEKDKHTLVLSDKLNYPNCDVAEIDYPASMADRVANECILSWDHSYDFVSGRWEQVDYDFKKPSTSLKVSSSKHGLVSLTSNSGYELYDNPNTYSELDEGREESKRRMEEEETRFDTVNGSSSCPAFAPGYVFKIKSHPNVPSEAKKSYLLTSVMHLAQQGSRLAGSTQQNSYKNQFVCIPKERQFRPQRRSPNTIISSIQTAIVVGPDGEEIYTDEFGRVKVQFHWDREGKRDENTCCWVRVSQTHAGPGFGGIDIPRIGEEVIVSFIEGDPDRPVITGRLYHAENRPPFDLPKYKTRSGFRTKTYKGDGYNEIIFEDKTDDECIFMHAQKDLEVRVLNDVTSRVFGNQHQVVGWEKDGQKGGDLVETVYQDKHVNVKRHQFEHVEGSMALIVGGGDAASGGNLDVVIERDKCELIEGESNTMINGHRNESVGGDVSSAIGGSHNLAASKDIAMEAGAMGDIHLKAGMKVIIEAGMQLSLVGPGGFIDIGPSGVTIQGILVNINSGGSKGTGKGCKTKQVKEAKKTKPKQPNIAKNSK
ncbi:MAG: type VI secretion system Vgr family protein [Planctomycetota bacterium]|jgi:type VI secretion system secreted protein VgrG